MKKYFYEIFFLFIGIVFISCQDKSSTEPTSSFKDPRSYTWEKDSVNINDDSQLLIFGVFPLSPNEIYAYGHSAVSLGQLWKYDGVSWKVFDINNYFSPSLNVTGMWGYSSGNIWLVGTKFITRNGMLDLSGYIIQYNGTSAKEIFPGTEDMYNCVYGSDENNIWVGGNNGRLYQYNGRVWKKEIINSSDTLANKINIRKVVEYKNDLFVTGSVLHNEPGFGGEIYYCLRRTGNQWYQIGQIKRNPPTWGFKKFLISPDKKLYSVFPDIYRWENNAWNVFFNNDNTYDYGYLDASFVDNRILAVSWGGNSKYFDGSQWFLLDNLTPLSKNIELVGVYLTNTAAFIIGNKKNRLYIFHGK